MIVVLRNFFLSNFTYTVPNISDSGKESPEESSTASPQASSSPAPASQEQAAPHTIPVNCSAAPKSSLQCIAVLPGLGVYTDSSDSDNADFDSDEDDDVQSQVPQQPRDITGRIVKPVAQCSGQQGC